VGEEAVHPPASSGRLAEAAAHAAPAATAATRCRLLLLATHEQESLKCKSFFFPIQ
jgi:hypothetical protein